ncbi:uncharacterized protein [Haliotis asinina]|uniref:uncharacterized protein n=1 Tax=Haliotis asinina TaxID=109174 RepID=UPI00353203A3
MRLLDSLSFFNTKQANLPKIFHLKELKKGYFPHYFNTQANQQYVGPYLEASFYGVNSMSTQGRSDFLRWHAERKDNLFDFAQEMEDYCRSDVQILREALMTFRQLLSVTEKTCYVTDPHTQQIIPKKEPGIDPTDYVTIASVCHGVFKHKFLTEYTHVKLLWDKTVLPHTKQSLSELYALTMKRNTAIKEKGYNLVTLWEHEFRQQLKTNPELKNYVAILDLQQRLDPRDSFFGGRTNASKSKLFHEAGDGEDILYYDFTSLYPRVNKYGRYPVGHPQIITTNFKSLDQCFGIAKVKVLPPRGLYHPVLPLKSQGKLKFALCRTCADSEQQTPCRHTDEERSFIGTWCTPELQIALEKGYKILKVYKVYHWAETTQYHKTTQSGGLFASYINTFLKIKQQASGWPAWCQTEADKQQYVDNYLTNEGIQLDSDKLSKNPGLRALSKLMLNSFWGKYAQRPKMKQTKFFFASKLEEYYQFLTDPKKTLHDFLILNHNVAQFQWTHDTEFIPESDTTNIFIASFTTCWARLKLYSVLDMLQERVLYYDTDSIIFVSRPVFVSLGPQAQFSSDGQHGLIILDDLLHQVLSSNNMELLFTQGCHHRRLSVIFITQNLYGQGKSAGTIALNTWYLVLFKNVRDILQMMTLGQQLFPGRAGILVEAYIDAMKQPYGYVVLDMSPRAEDKPRLRTRIFPGEDPIVYVSRL